jgi:hypothetical protein
MADFQYSKKSNKTKRSSDKIFKRESDITKDKNDCIKKNGGSPKGSSSESEF